MVKTKENYNDVLHLCDNHIFVPFNVLFNVIQQDKKFDVKEIQELNNKVVKYLAKLDFFISFDGFYALVDEEFTKISTNHLRCIVKNDVDFPSKYIKKYLDALLKYAQDACDYRKNNLKD
jgi:diacylglycerol kinase family enzyme